MTRPVMVTAARAAMMSMAMPQPNTMTRMQKRPGQTPGGLVVLKGLGKVRARKARVEKGVEKREEKGKVFTSKARKENRAI
jgi:hypothetical protein